MKQTETRSLWQATACAPPDTTVLSENISTDVLIVGGGYTGLSSALHLAESGADVVVLEAEHIGHGGSGRNMGQVNAGFLVLPRHVVEHVGPELGEIMNATFAKSTELVFDLIDRHHIDCDVQKNGNLFLAHNDRSRRLIQDFFEQHSATGAPVQWLERAQTESMVGSPRYSAAVLDKRAGTIQPLSYARGLARAALGAGASVFTQSRVETLKRNGNRWKATTLSGNTVNAEHVVLATDSYSDQLWPGLRQTLVPITAQQVATRPLSENLARTIVPDGRGTADRMTYTHYFRKDRDNRLLMVTGGPAAPPPDMIKRFFPQLNDVTFEYQWNGLVSISRDKLPRIYQPAPGVMAVMGYSGRGLSSGTLMGRLIAKYLTEHTPLPLPTKTLEKRFLPKLHAGALNLGLSLFRRLDPFIN